MINKTLLEFEAKFNVSPAKACKILGITAGNYSDLRSGKRELRQRYLINSIASHMALSDDAIMIIKRELLNE